MILKDDFNTRGQWLFSQRSYIPLVLIPLTALVMYFSRDYPQAFALTLRWKIICLVVALLGMVIRAVAVGTTPSGTSGRNTGSQIAKKLNSTGIYSVVRHPLYVGNFVTILGIVMWTGIWWYLMLVTVLYWFYYERIMYTEEEFLLSEYGDELRDWANRTPAVIPSFKNYTKASLPFSMKTVMAREYDGLLAIATSFLLLGVLEWLFGSASFVDEVIWIYFFIAIFILAAVLRYARKHTSLLSVSDR